VSQDIALYIHIPFCHRKCNYCAFVSYEQREADIPSYLAALEKELWWRCCGERVRSIYFGGGTPSLLSAEQVDHILTTVSSLFIMDEEAEITIEANPGTIDIPYLSALKALGVDRLSIGVQSLNDSELALLGRIHTAAQARDAVHFARQSGFDNLSIDLMCGLPRQTLPDWRKTLDEIIEMGPEHLSIYALSIEAGTPIWRAIEDNGLPSIDPDLSADQYELAEDLLAVHGYRHYEISNWARQGRECRHNITYWQGLPYLGAGVAAHSYLNAHRLANTPDMEEYLAAFSSNVQPAPYLDEEITPELELAEAVILGLRLCEGVCTDAIRSRFGIEPEVYYGHRLEELAGSGLLEYNDKYIKLTRRGRLLSNEVLWRFLPD